MRKEKQCSDSDIYLKSFFLGPQSENAIFLIQQYNLMLTEYFNFRKSIYPNDGVAISIVDQNNKKFKTAQKKVTSLVKKLGEDFQKEVPKFSPRYIGHMLSENSIPSLLGHFITLLHNPNNISNESSRVGVKIEQAAIRELAMMIGYDSKKSYGHFTSGGTIANFEGLIRAKARAGLWLSMVAHNQQSKSIFSDSLGGWSEYKKMVKAHKVSSSELNFNLGNPFVAYRTLSKKYKINFNGPVILVPSHKHYSWNKAAYTFGLGEEAIWPIEIDAFGHLCLKSLRKSVDKAYKEHRPILMVVSVVGTTELGSIDQVNLIQQRLEHLKKERNWHLWHHVDAAYGGFFLTLKNSKSKFVLKSTQASLNGIMQANSITIDPHKLGYVPYSSGAFLVRDKMEYNYHQYHTPYIDFNQTIDKGAQTLEGSRSAGGSVSTYLMAKSIGLNANGFGRIIEKTFQAKYSLEKILLQKISNIQIPEGLDSNIITFCIAYPHESVATTNKRTKQIFENFSPYKNNQFVVSKTELDMDIYKDFLKKFIKNWNGKIDTKKLMLIRICLMNPFFISTEPNVYYPELFADLLNEFILKQASGS